MNVTEFKTKIMKILEDNPQNVNPANQNDECLYTSEDGESHCVIGQLAISEGWWCPQYGEVIGARKAAAEYDWPVDDEVVGLMVSVQLTADRFVMGEPIAWSIVADDLKRKWG